MEMILYIGVIVTGLFTAALFYQSGMRTGKTLILLGLLANFLVITLKFGYVEIEFWFWFMLGTGMGLLIMFSERHTIPSEFSKMWDNVSDFWLGQPENKDKE